MTLLIAIIPFLFVLALVGIEIYNWQGRRAARKRQIMVWMERGKNGNR